MKNHYHKPRRPRAQHTVARVHIEPQLVFEDMLHDLREGSNSFAWACCPFHDDHNPSFCVNLHTGWYKCHASHCGATGTNIVGFVGALQGIDYRAARTYLETHYG